MLSSAGPIFGLRVESLSPRLPLTQLVSSAGSCIHVWVDTAPVFVFGRGGRPGRWGVKLGTRRSLVKWAEAGLADKKVFPQSDFIGWYSTGAALHDEDMAIHKSVRRAPPSFVSAFSEPP